MLMQFPNIHVSDDNRTQNLDSYTDLFPRTNEIRLFPYKKEWLAKGRITLKLSLAVAADPVDTTPVP
jgi:hypothetical protein